MSFLDIMNALKSIAYIRSYLDDYERKTAPRLSLGESSERQRLAH